MCGRWSVSISSDRRRALAGDTLKLLEQAPLDDLKDGPQAWLSLAERARKGRRERPSQPAALRRQGRDLVDLAQPAQPADASSSDREPHATIGFPRPEHLIEGDTAPELQSARRSYCERLWAR